MSTLLKATRLSRFYGDFQAVKNVSVTLSQGDIMGLLGPNGAGKTTTMDMLAGNLAPSSGNIEIKGVNLLDEPKRAKQSIGYLPEQPPVYRDLTVDEYLRYCARLHGIRRQQIASSVDRARERTGLVDTGRRLIGNLSKGYQQRVGIAQAIIHEPDVIILDEPTVGLDPIQIHEIRELIRELGTRHGVILSTHILPEVQTICNRVHILYEGRIAYDDASTAQQSHPEILVRFNRPADLESLGGLGGIIEIQSLENNGYRIIHSNNANPSDEIARLAVEGKWGLLELTPASPGLEQVFLNLARGEQSRETSTDHETEKNGAAA